MPWRIPCARCPRCARQVGRADLAAVPERWVLADEDAATLWPRGPSDAPAGVKTCADCREDPQGTRISTAGTEKRAPMPIFDIMDSRETNDDCHLTYSVAALEA